MDGEHTIFGGQAAGEGQAGDSQGKIQLDKLSTGRPTLGTNYDSLGGGLEEAQEGAQPNGVSAPTAEVEGANVVPCEVVENGSNGNVQNVECETACVIGEPKAVEGEVEEVVQESEGDVVIEGDGSECDFSVEEAQRGSNEVVPVQNEAQPEVQMQVEVQPVIEHVQAEQPRVAQHVEEAPQQVIENQVVEEVVAVQEPVIEEPEAQVEQKSEPIVEEVAQVEEVQETQIVEAVEAVEEAPQQESAPIVVETQVTEIVQESEPVVAEETQIEPIQVEENQSEEIVVEEAAEEIKAEPIQAEEIQVEEVQAEEIQVEEVQVEEIQVEEVAPVVEAEAQPQVEEVAEEVKVSVAESEEIVEEIVETGADPVVEELTEEPVQNVVEAKSEAEEPVAEAVAAPVETQQEAQESEAEVEPEVIAVSEAEPVAEPEVVAEEPAQVECQSPQAESESQQEAPQENVEESQEAPVAVEISEPIEEVQVAEPVEVPEIQPELATVPEPIEEAAPISQAEEEDEEVEESSDSIVPFEGLLPGVVSNGDDEDEDIQETAPVEQVVETQAEPIVEETQPEPIVEETQAVAAEPVEEVEKVEEVPVVNTVLVRNRRIADEEDGREYNLNGENRVYLWGSAECDQFDCENYESKRPVEIGYFINNKIKVSKIVCGSQHSLILDNKGRAYSWGNSDNGALGRTVTGESTVPGLVDLGGKEVDLISAGDSHSAFANSVTGKVYFCGVILSSNGPISQKVRTPVDISGFGTGKGGVAQLVSGQNHVLILSSSKIYTFGDDSNGAIGHVRRGYNSKTDCLTPTSLNIKSVNRVFTGANHCFATTRRGNLYAWGLNSAGQLGLPYYIDLGDDSDVNNSDPARNANVLQTPHLISQFKSADIRTLQGGDHHTLLLTTDGSVYGTGLNTDGQLGNFVHPKRESYPETQGNGQDQFVKVAGRNFRVLVTEDYMPNSFFKLSNVSQTPYSTIMAQHVFSYGVDLRAPSNPKYYAWGTGFNYVLGNGNEETVETPWRISNEKFFQQQPPTGLALGHSHIAYFTGKRNVVHLEATERKRQNRLRKRESSIAARNVKRKRVKTK